MISLTQLIGLVTPKAKRIRRNVENAADAFARSFLSLERVGFVKARPCAACGIRGHSENAHLLGNDGARRRGPYTEIGPLCGWHRDPRGSGKLVSCHRLYDTERWKFNARFPSF